MRRFLLLFVLAVAAAGQSAEVVVTEAGLFGALSGAGKVITFLPRWSKVEILKEGDPWVLVQTTEYVGWMPLRSIAIKAPAITSNVPVSTSSPTSPPQQAYQ